MMETDAMMAAKPFPRRAALLFLLFLTLAVFFSINYRIVVVNGHSMEPTYRNKEMLIITHAYWMYGPLRRDDVVMIKHDGELLLKRIAALPGEIVPIEALPHYMAHGFEVPQGHVWVTGDNRFNSEDSRSFGALPLREILGKTPYPRPRPQQ